jgi:hypothetical protein
MPTTIRPVPKILGYGEPSATKTPHDGGIDDVDAIGNRNVGCAKGMGTGTAWEQIAMGKQISMQLETSQGHRRPGGF